MVDHSSWLNIDFEAFPIQAKVIACPKRFSSWMECRLTLLTRMKKKTEQEFGKYENIEHGETD